MKTALRIFDKSINVVCAVTLASTFAIVVLNVVLRYVFRTGLAWSEEGARYLFVFMIFLGFIPNTRDSSHFQIAILTNALPEKFQKCVLLIKNGIFAALLVLMIKGAYAMSTNVVTKSAALGIPNTLIFKLLAFSGCAMILYVIRQAISDLLVKGKGEK
jgi:TRAP-type C4-dicarboxylate transport system permease small subunit